MKNSNSRAKNTLFLIISAAVIGIDQLTKWLFYGSSYSLIGDFLWIESSFNTGAAFSMLAGAQWLFFVITVVCCALMIYLLFTQAKPSQDGKTTFALSKFSKVCLAMIIGGALGNLIDRIVLGGVRDFIYFKSINFAIFNIADSFITVGAILLAISLIISLVGAKKAGKTDNGNNN